MTSIMIRQSPLEDGSRYVAIFCVFILPSADASAHYLGIELASLSVA